MESLLSRLRGLVVYRDGMLIIGQMQAEHLKTLGDSSAAITVCMADIPERQMCLPGSISRVPWAPNCHSRRASHCQEGGGIAEGPAAPNLSTVLAPLYQLLKVTAAQEGTGIWETPPGLPTAMPSVFKIWTLKIYCLWQRPPICGRRVPTVLSSEWHSPY